MFSEAIAKKEAIGSPEIPSLQELKLGSVNRSYCGEA
jgi:hypothetical protein